MGRKSGSRQVNYQCGLDTRRRIIERSIELFNQNNIQNVTIENIAVDLQISPGNITYHFKLRRDLIRASLDLLQERLGEAMERPQVSWPQEAGEYVIRGFRPLWDFRFFFNSMVSLTRHDQELRTRYFEFRQWAVEAVARDLEGLVALGYFRPPKTPNSTLLISENMWALWLSWLRTQQIEDSAAKTPSAEALYDFALHLWSLCQPHLATGFGQALLRELQQALAPDRLEAAAANY